MKGVHLNCLFICLFDLRIGQDFLDFKIDTSVKRIPRSFSNGFTEFFSVLKSANKALPEDFTPLQPRGI